MKKVQRKEMIINSKEGTERNDGIHIVKKAQRKMMEYI